MDGPSMHLGRLYFKGTYYKGAEMEDSRNTEKGRGSEISYSSKAASLGPLFRSW